MIRKRLSPEERLARWHDQQQRGSVLEQLLKDPVFTDWEKSYRERIVAEMIAANATDDDMRRGCALKLQALLDFKSDIANLVGAGKRATRNIEKMETDDARTTH